MKYIIKIPIKLEQKLCERCKKIDPAYYNLLLQLRFFFFDNKQNLEKLKTQIKTILTQKFNKLINKQEDTKNQLNFYFSKKISLSFLKNLLEKNYLTNTKSSKTIMGFDKLNSKDLYRNTFLLEIFNLCKNRDVTYQKTIYTIKNIINKTLYLQNKKTGSIKKLLLKEFLSSSGNCGV